LEDGALIKAIECHFLQLTFLMHQCRRLMAAHNCDAVKLLREKEETAKVYERLMSDYHSLQKKNYRRKAAVERIRQEHDSLKKQLEEMEATRATEATERADLEKKLQGSGLETRGREDAT
jgi:predicted nuclease with TOPRIM domain